jgi:hypothetical protein
MSLATACLTTGAQLQQQPQLHAWVLVLLHMAQLHARRKAAAEGAATAATTAAAAQILQAMHRCR